MNIRQSDTPWTCPDCGATEGNLHAHTCTLTPRQRVRSPAVSDRRRWEKRAADAYEHASECVRDGDHDGALAVASAASEALRVVLGERPIGDLDDWFVDNLEALDG